MNGQAPAQMTADETSRLAEAGNGILYCVLVLAQHGEKHLRMRIVRRHLDFSDRDHSHAWVFQLERDDLGQIALDLVGDAQSASGDGFAMFGHAKRNRQLYKFVCRSSGRWNTVSVNNVTIIGIRRLTPVDSGFHRDGSMIFIASQSTSDFLDFKHFQLIALLDVVEILQ